ncbi:MAG TPA: NUDIX hydrolase [Stellaceae bacterium]
MTEPDWLLWARRLQAIAQNGLTFVQDPYDKERYEQIRALAAEMMAVRGGGDPARIEALFAEQSGYATPKVDVRAAAFRADGALLMVREANDGRWSLPGGWVDVNQSPREAVIREVREETGFEVSVLKLAAVFDRSKHGHLPARPFHVYKLFFRCEIVGGAPQTSLETTEIGFFGEDSLPAELSIGRVVPYQIGRMFAHYRNPGLPTEFD